MAGEFNNLYFSAVQNVSFYGINFEDCRGNSSNVFFQESSDISFQNCVFRYVLGGERERERVRAVIGGVALGLVFFFFLELLS